MLRKFVKLVRSDIDDFIGFWSRIWNLYGGKTRPITAICLIAFMCLIAWAYFNAFFAAVAG